MLQLWPYLRRECFGLARREESPYATSTIAVLRVGAYWIAGLEREVFLYAEYRRVIVVFYFAEL
jgi:hypothetical protein